MKSAKKLILAACGYSIGIGLMMIILSTLSLFAYNCHFDFTRFKWTYMLYLLYFRAAECESYVNWQLLGWTQDDLLIPQPNMPPETFAVFITFIFSSVYFFLNVLLVITSVFALCKYTYLKVHVCKCVIDVDLIP